MKAVKGYTKHDYIMICKEEGGEVFSFASIDEAAGYFSCSGMNCRLMLHLMEF